MEKNNVEKTRTTSAAMSESLGNGEGFVNEANTANNQNNDGRMQHVNNGGDDSLPSTMPQSYSPSFMSKEDRATLKTALATVLLVRRFNESQKHTPTQLHPPQSGSLSLAPWLEPTNGTLLRSNDSQSASRNSHRSNHSKITAPAGPAAAQGLDNDEEMSPCRQPNGSPQNSGAQSRFLHLRHMMHRAITQQTEKGVVAKSLLLHLAEHLSLLSDNELCDQGYDNLIKDLFLTCPESGPLWEQLFHTSMESETKAHDPSFAVRFGLWIHELIHSLWPGKSSTFDHYHKSRTRHHETQIQDKNSRGLGNKEPEMLTLQAPQPKLSITQALSLVPLLRCIWEDMKHLQPEPNPALPLGNDDLCYERTAQGIYFETSNGGSHPQGGLVEEKVLLEYYLRNLGVEPNPNSAEEEL